MVLLIRGSIYRDSTVINGFGEKILSVGFPGPHYWSCGRAVKVSRSLGHQC